MNIDPSLKAYRQSTPPKRIPGRDPNLLAIELLQNGSTRIKDVMEPLSHIADDLDFKRTMVVEYGKAHAGQGFISEKTLRSHPHRAHDQLTLEGILDRKGFTQKTLLGLMGLPYVEPLLLHAIEHGQIELGADPLAGIADDGKPYGVLEAALFVDAGYCWIPPIIETLELDAAAVQRVADLGLARLELMIQRKDQDSSNEVLRQMRSAVLHASLLASRGAQLAPERWLPVLEAMDVGDKSFLLSANGSPLGLPRSLVYVITHDLAHPGPEDVATKFAAIEGVIAAGWPWESLLHIAVERLDVDLVREALRLGARLNAFDGEGRTALESLSAHHSDFNKAFNTTAYDAVVRILQSATANEHAKAALREIASSPSREGLAP